MGSGLARRTMTKLVSVETYLSELTSQKKHYLLEKEQPLHAKAPDHTQPLQMSP